MTASDAWDSVLCHRAPVPRSQDACRGVGQQMAQSCSFELVPVANRLPHCMATLLRWWAACAVPAHQKKTLRGVASGRVFNLRAGGWCTPIPRCLECIKSLYGGKLLFRYSDLRKALDICCRFASACALALSFASRSAVSQASIQRSACSRCACTVLGALPMRRAVSFTPRSRK